MGVQGFAEGADAGFLVFGAGGYLFHLWGRMHPLSSRQRAVLDCAFTVWKRDRVISLICPDNLASIRVAKRIGERPQGRTTLAGTEFLLYGIDRESYQEMGTPALALRGMGAAGVMASASWPSPKRPYRGASQRSCA